MGGMIAQESDVTTSENYRRFARLEPANRSHAYERLAERCSYDTETSKLQFLSPTRWFCRVGQWEHSPSRIRCPRSSGTPGST